MTTGCATVEASDGETKVTHSDDGRLAYVECVNSRHSWRLHCAGTVWRHVDAADAGVASCADAARPALDDNGGQAAPRLPTPHPPPHGLQPFSYLSHWQYTRSQTHPHTHTHTLITIIVFLIVSSSSSSSMHQVCAWSNYSTPVTALNQHHAYWKEIVSNKRCYRSTDISLDVSSNHAWKIEQNG